MAGPLARLYATLGLDAREFDTGLGRAQKSISGFGRGTDLAIAGIAGAVAGGLVSTVGMAREWESAFTGVKKTLDTTGLTAEQEAKAFGQLSDELLDLSTTIPVAATELAGLAEAGGAMGVAREDITEFARVTAMLGATTDVVAQDAATALGKIGNVMGLTADQYQHFGDVLVDLGNKGSSFESEILDTANRIAGTADVIGLSADELLGWSAALANVGILPEAAGGSFQRFGYMVQSAVIKGGKQLDKLAEITGMTAEAFQDLFNRDQSAALEAVVRGYAGLSDGAKLAAREVLKLKGVRDTDFINKLAGDIEGLTSTLDTATTTTGALTVEFGKRVATVDSKMQIFQAQLFKTGVTLGNALLPPLTMAAEHVGNLVGILGDAAEAFPAVTAVIVPLTTALAGLTAIRFGARFLGLTALEPLLSKGIGAAWKGAAAATRAGIAAVGAAGGLIYAKAVVVGERLMSLISSAWVAIGRPGSTVMMKATLAGSVAAGSFLAGLAKGLTVVGIAAVVGEAVNEGLRQAGVEVRGWDELMPIGPRAMDEWLERHGVPLTRQAFDPIEESLLHQLAQMYQPLFKAGQDAAEAVPAGFVSGARSLGSAVTDSLSQMFGSLPDAVEASVREARRRLFEGIGSIKQALANPGQFISREDRLKNMERRQRRVFKNLRRAVEIDDPFNINYWTKAAIQQQIRMDRVRGGTGAATDDILKKFKAMGVDIDGTWLATERSARRSSRRGKNIATQAAEDTASQVSGILGGLDFTLAGLRAGITFAKGLTLASNAARVAAENIAGQVARFWQGESPPPEGPLSTIDKGGENVIKAWLGGMERVRGRVSAQGSRMAGAFTPTASMAMPALAVAGAGQSSGTTIVVYGNVYGGKAGLRQLQADIDAAVQPTRRIRRLNGRP